MKKRYWIPLVTLASIPVAVYLFLQSPVFGARPSAEDKLRFAASPVYNPEKGVFQNRRPDVLEQMRSDSFSFALLKEYLSQRVDARPSEPMPERVPDMAKFLEISEHTKLIWLGHSSFLLNISGTIILVDPVFSNTASPFSFTTKRFQPSVIPLRALPEIDLVLISHDHYDHLDQKTIAFFVDSNTRFLMPLGVGVHLKRWGISPQAMVELDWWESYRFNDIEFSATPAQHFSGRTGFNNDETLWASWVLHSMQSRLFYSGDSGYDSHFKEIGERYGPFDLSIMENGQYNQAWASVHLFPAETVQAHQDLNASILLPVHWGMFELALHTWYDPVEDLSKVADREQVALITPLIGQMVLIGAELDSTRWWQSSVSSQ